MINILKTLLLILLFVGLNACVTLQTKEEKEKKTTAAKINIQLGMSYLDRHDIPRAKQKFLIALDEDPKLPDSWYSMAYFLENTSNSDEAKSYYLKAISLNPTKGESLNNYGTYLCRTQHYNESVQYFLMAVKDPNYLGVSEAYENAGNCSLKMADEERAIQYFSKSLSEDPNRSSSLIQLAELHYKKGKYQLAKNELLQFLNLSNPTMQSFALQQKLDKKLKIRG